MLRNYFITAIRNLFREKSLSVINIAGLTLGITASIVLFLIIDFHSSFDKFHSKRDRIYRVVNSSQSTNGTDYQPGCPSVLPDAFRLDFPQAEEVVFTAYRTDALILVPRADGSHDKFQEESGVVYTEPSFFRIFDRTVLRGEGYSGLDAPNEAVISRSIALKYFGSEDVLGKLIRYGNNDFKIAGLVEDAPRNTDLPFNVFLSYVTVKTDIESAGWGSVWSDEQCYFLLKESESIASMDGQLRTFLKRHFPDSQLKKSEIFAQPLSDLHHDDRFNTYNYNTVSRSMLSTLWVVALILVVTGCINFINLSTAEAVKRSKEVGIRKTLGGTRLQLLFQFLGETTIITTVSVLLSIAAAQIALSVLNPFLDLELSLDLGNNQALVIFLLIITIAVSLLSGIYPAVVVSGFSPALAIKNQFTNKSSSGYLMRSSLVVIQFFISQFFIIGTIVLVRQMDFVRSKDLGFSKEAVIVVPMPDNGGNSMETAMKKKTFKHEASTIAGVEMVTMGNTPPSSGSISVTSFQIEGDGERYTTQVKQVDGNYLDLFGLRMVGGSKLGDLDSANGYVVNETFVKSVGFQDPNDVIGKNITIWGSTNPIVGVVADFHTVSLERRIAPTILFNNPNGYEMLALKVRLSETESVLNSLKSKWEATFPEGLFEYEFLDDSIRQFYDGERKMTTLMTVFSALAIFIGCLGLFGLATFMANQKRKEIGVRKVMGASVTSILILFSREFAKLIVIGFLIAAPLAFLAMQQFLNEFAYKIDLSIGIFLMGLAITFVVAFVTVGYRSVAAAIVNPVKSLRYE